MNRFLKNYIVSGYNFRYAVRARYQNTAVDRIFRLCRLHGFASEEAYGACIYLHTLSMSGGVEGSVIVH